MADQWKVAKFDNAKCEENVLCAWWNIGKADETLIYTSGCAKAKYCNEVIKWQGKDAKV